MEHMIEESLLMDELNYESSDMTKKSSLISGGSVGHLRRIRKLTPEEEDAYRQKLALKNQIYGTGKISDRIFANIQKYNHEEYQYLNILKNIMENDFWEEGRNGKTKSIFGTSMRFSLKDNKIPILTTKKTAWKTCLKELLWFIRGETDNKILKEQGVHIWDANGSREFLDSRGLTNYPVDELGPVYGRQWRQFNALCDPYGHQYEGSQGVDQLQQIIDALKDPKHRTSRRLVMSAWNPIQLPLMALPPCHILCQFNVHDGNKLSCAMYQRSGDFPLGIPFNIASYSFLTHLIAKHCGLEAYEFVHFVGNCHIYEDHIEPMKEQILREPFEFPTLSIKQIRENISDYQVEDFEVHDYKSHEAIKMKMVA
jgi:thymidylate synthase